MELHKYFLYAIQQYNFQYLRRCRHVKEEMTGPCDLYFCTEPGCVDFFKDVKAIEMHMISGQHNVPTVASSMDHVKQCYANKMKMSKPNALSTVSGQLMSSEKKTTL